MVAYIRCLTLHVGRDIHAVLTAPEHIPLFVCGRLEVAGRMRTGFMAGYVSFREALLASWLRMEQGSTTQIYLSIYLFIYLPHLYLSS